MKRFLLSLTLAAGLSGHAAAHDETFHPARLQNVALDAVRWTGGFWQERFNHLHRVLIPGTLDGVCLEEGNGANLRNFLRAAGLDSTPAAKASRWGDGDCFYLLEAVSRVYAVTKDPALDAMLDRWIGVIAHIQQTDGYVGSRESLGVGPKWSPDIASADYNHGHLLAAAIAHRQATGKDTFMAIARRALDAVHARFLEKSKDSNAPVFGMNLIMDLLAYYRYTGDQRCLDIARWNLDHKGRTDGRGDQWQNGPPVRDETEAVGHATGLAWTYVSAAMAAAETGDRSLWEASVRIWDDIHRTKYHIHGGYGNNADPGCFKSPVRVINGVTYGGESTAEGYAPAYQIWNTFMSCESCANFDAALWSFELFSGTGDARYVDAVERVLHNALPGAIALDEARWFYSTPHERRSTDTFNGDRTRERWRKRAGFCCPPNLMRGIAITGQWAYSTGPTGVWVNLYGANRLDTRLADGTPVRLVQKSDYPWSGDIRLEIEQAGDAPFDLALRIPGWVDAPATVTVNGEPVAGPVTPGAYFKIHRRWQAGDRVALTLPLNVRLVECHPDVVNNRNHVAVFRGPVLYVQEQCDLPDGVGIDDLVLPAHARFTVGRDPAFLKDFPFLTTQAVKGPLPRAITRPVDLRGWDGKLYRDFTGRDRRDDLTGAAPLPLKLIPYFAWANRTQPFILAWFPLPGAEKIAEPVPPTDDSFNESPAPAAPPISKTP